MSNQKPLNELTIKDNFMFAAVMSDSANSLPLLEMILGIKIAHIDVVYEKNLVYNPQYHGVRLDVYAKDDAGTHYDIEMQVEKRDVLKRSRYYHSQMDMDVLPTCVDYTKLPTTYVIFICDYDPFGLGLYTYTGVKTFKEAPDYDADDGSRVIFLSTRGTNDVETPDCLVKFLQFVRLNLDECNNEFDDPYVQQIQYAVADVKSSREMGMRYMLIEEMLRGEREEGRAEGQVLGIVEMILRYLDKFDVVTPDLKEQMKAIGDVQILTDLFDRVTGTSSLEEIKQTLSDYVQKVNS